MKKILMLIPALLLFTSCDWFVFDNEESYDATITGRFIDSQTGDLVQFAHPNTDKFQIIEKDWDTEKAQDWYVKPNGTYTNKTVFAGSYVMHTLGQNFYPAENIPFEIKKGDNVVDFTVSPYARVLDPEITYEGTWIVARFKVQCSDPSQTTKVDAALFGYTDRFVSDGYNNFSKQSTSKKSSVKADGTTVIELKVNTEVASGSQFTYKRDHFLRIGVVATGKNVNTKKCYNYSPVYLMDQNFSNVTEVTVWDE
ncbi:MAG: DUF3823 domain-containing protein [Bacteroidales bacterium]|nr:DUF3823 domain-containing protein [Bacteroidales bacterium]